MARIQEAATAAARQQFDRPTGRDFRVLTYLWRFVRPYKLQVAGAMVALVIAAGTLLAIGTGLRGLVDEGFAAGDTGRLDRAVLGLFGVVVVLALASYGRYYLVTWIGERVIADVRKTVYGHVIRLSPAYYETTRTGEVLSRLTSDTTVLQTVVGTSVSIALRNTLLFAGGLIMLLITSPKLTGLVLLVTPLVVFPILLFGRRVRRLSRDSQDRIADVGAYVDESLNAIRTVQAFTHEDLDRARFTGRVEEAFTTAVARIRARAWLTALVILLVFGAVSAVLWIGGRDVLNGRISGGELASFVFYAVVVAGAFGAIGEVIGDLQRASGATERLIELLRTEPEIAAPAQPVALPEPPVGAVRFESVAFRYPARPDAPALEGFDLAVEPGETVALVGPSGAGKSTVFQLLLRFYDPQAGRILFDGVDLREADPQALRQRIGLVPQDAVIFSADAWENIRYGRPGASDDEVREAAEAAGCTEFLDALPQGFATFLGERGVRLSGGQRQRLAIARAILRDPAVLLLDEATSALDSESERMVQGALDRLSRGRSTLVIAHRLATVQRAHRIVVLDRGGVVASGTHESLMAEPEGLYRRLATLQFDQADRFAGNHLSPALPLSTAGA
ncbi:ABC transporter transmembrane domain-containing protein [Aquibaculum arenosum]|uniref:ABC transporter transmembrane domain-containing protein n=1 Tax=Aquibaculum arenosum TaxID=3032591 RepID=A0ABT5YPR6_9PROT|nr:ABC transporter transmembrane domain-containing protein [Fodinicurvata sp. CAU 1616]MDF2096837.1 ABC transporter transmembrane domain-containing protein [Fodinicurvata sp. CAU 1616]